MGGGGHRGDENNNPTVYFRRPLVPERVGGGEGGGERIGRERAGKISILINKDPPTSKFFQYEDSLYLQRHSVHSDSDSPLCAMTAHTMTLYSGMSLSHDCSGATRLSLRDTPLNRSMRSLAR